MATSDSREVVIEASPEEILDVIADIESTPAGRRSTRAPRSWRPRTTAGPSGSR
jgi:hypothetical protein